MPNVALSEKVVTSSIGSAVGEQSLAINARVSKCTANHGEEEVLASVASLANCHALSVGIVMILLPPPLCLQCFQMSVVDVVIEYHFRSYSMLPMTSRTFSLRER
jgi:hypothetical protein